MNNLSGQRILDFMPMTLEQIVEEARQWPPEQVGELVGRLTDELHARAPEIEAAWDREIDRRMTEIRTGKVKGIPADQVFAEIDELLRH